MVHTIIVISWLQPDVGERVLIHEMPRSYFALYAGEELAGSQSLQHLTECIESNRLCILDRTHDVLLVRRILNHTNLLRQFDQLYKLIDGGA